jgi:hypothetical protein
MPQHHSALSRRHSPAQRSIMAASHVPSRRRGGLIAVVLVLVVGFTGAAAAPVVVGTQAQQRLETMTARASERSPRLEWSVESFERGAYTSTATTRVTWRPPDGEREAVAFELHHRIQHGPRPGGLYWVRVETTPVLDGRLGARVGDIYGERHPIRATYTRRLSGAKRLQVRSPEAEWRAGGDGAGRFQSDGLDLAVESPGGAERWLIDGELPALALRGENGRLAVSGLSATGELGLEGRLANGELELRLERLDAGPTPDGGADAEPALSLRGLRLWQRVAEGDGAVSARFDFEADRLATAAAEYSDIAVSAALEGVPIELVERLSAAAREAQRPGQAPRHALLTTLQRFGAADAVAYGPSLTIEPIEAETASGPVSASARVGVAPPDAAAIGGWLDVLRSAQSRVQLDLPVPVAQGLVAGYLQRRVEAGDKARIEVLAQQQLASFERKGWLERGDDRVSAEIVYDAGVVRVNQQQVADLRRLLGG